MKSALIIRHVPVEGIAGYREPIEAAGYRLDRVDVEDPCFSDIDLSRPDLLIMMGGPMSVYEGERYPWIECQKRRLAARLARGKATLGVCLGAQLIASALGARVYRGPAGKEVGFHPLTLADTPSAAPLRHLASLPVLHWHGDTFDLPDGAELLAASAAYAHQAFRYGENVLALQFHAEMGLDPRFDEWVDRWPDDIAAAGTSADRLRADHALHGPAVAGAGRAMIADWLATLA